MSVLPYTDCTSHLESSSTNQISIHNTVKDNSLLTAKNVLAYEVRTSTCTRMEIKIRSCFYCTATMIACVQQCEPVFEKSTFTAQLARYKMNQHGNSCGEFKAINSFDSKNKGSLQKAHGKSVTFWSEWRLSISDQSLLNYQQQQHLYTVQDE
jgi:hypothetical protein